MPRRILLAAVVLAAATAWAAPPTVPELLQLVPSEARAVVAVDAAALRDEPLVQKWLLDHQDRWGGVDGEAARFLRDAGVDPAADVDALVFALLDNGEHEHPLVLFGGRFDAASLTAAVLARGAEAEELGGVTVYRLDPNAGGAQAVLMRITDDFIMVGDRDGLAASFGRGAGPVHIVADEMAAGHLELTAPFWMAADIPEGKSPQTPPPGLNADSPEGRVILAVLAASSAVRRIAGWAGLDEELELHGFATAASDEEAGLLRDTLRGGLAVMRLAAQEHRPELVDVLRGVSVEADGAVVSVAATIPVSLLQELAGGAHPSARAQKTRRVRPR